jgi:hypothetical protein
MKPETKQILERFIDELETEYGNLEGVEIKFDHPVVEDERQVFATIREVTLIHLSKTKIEL